MYSRSCDFHWIRSWKPIHLSLILPDKDNTREKKSTKGRGKSNGSSDGDSQQDDQADAGGKKSRQVEDEMTIKYTKEENEYYRKNINGKKSGYCSFVLCIFFYSVLCVSENAVRKELEISL